MQKEEEFWTKLWYDDIAKKQARDDRDVQEAKAKADSMAKVITEQMQIVEAERALEKSKRKEYSDAAVRISLVSID